MSLAMTKQEREDFLADLHVGIISITEEGRGPLTVPIWYSYAPDGEVRVVTGKTSRKAQLIRRAGRFSLCAQTETPPYKYVSGWRATFYTSGMEHSPTSATGTAWERTLWHARQRAAWDAQVKAEEIGP